MSVERTITYLKIASGIVIGFGLLGFLGVWPALSMPIELFLDVIFWPVDNQQSLTSPESRLLLAITSGILVGWGALMWLIATQLYEANPKLARTMILTSITVWFIVDSTGSIISGAPINALLNLGFVALFYLPLRQTKPTLASQS